MPTRVRRRLPRADTEGSISNWHSAIGNPIYGVTVTVTLSYVNSDPSEATARST
jgi:hypothetical protein